MALKWILALAASATALPTIATISSRASTPASNHCGAPDSSVIVSGTPWIVYSMNYNYQDIDGTCCTGFAGLVTGADGEQKCAWDSTWDIAKVDSTSNVPKGYSFVGLTQNLENTISDIASIPATYNWVRSNETAYKGNVCFDFMTSDTKGDSTSSSAQELMLWLRYEGGQLPIGWADGAVATIQLYGKTWKLYQGVNTDTGITVSSLLVDQADQYYGYFAGDIKDWLLAMVKQGLFTSSTYVNVGNAGMEPFYGTVSFKNKLGLKINLA
ncbi:hypothetical protein LTR17_002367 [Elasticomyces elasticus]|uniref:Uncharacterized protein n=1 Tax=Elasticomyces elasticus TaxID=574655 RepID=A0AAN7VRP2_9PEZI|nr:hypothetical protein LTR10_009129 [Elasticomyces elasticus]KAK4971767.1 hypothetical protein LTR42_007495 [Elasticomyces elasticus]KAK5698259.1 hypothetical protein LTR97_007220 [Elasticomyces elasticus]KAK5713638.1 hypothetical protein LTR15_011338 [Elasticomyces elasticus]KAK5744029.1 hypothetical protein LTR17_002367 [Elasticomyces elasticus]